MAARKKAARKKVAAKAAAGRSSTAAAKSPAKPKAKARRKSAPARKLALGSRAGKVSLGDPVLLGEVEALAALMDAHGLMEVSYELDADGSKRVHVSRNSGVSLGPASHMAAPAPAPISAPAAGAGVAPAAPVAAAAPETGLHAFTSPMVGTFYRAASPEAPAFVSVGDGVDTNAVVCIIEAMKVMNEISPDLGGEVVSIEVENGEAVEFGQTLMLIRPR